MKAWLPKASTDNERSTVVIETPEGVEIMARQIAGAMARRIVTYAEPGESVRSRRTYGLHQVRFACGCIPSAGYGSSC